VLFHFSYICTTLKQVGDRVVALPEFRAWAELCAVPTKYVYKIPDELSFQDAAAMTMNYLVAYVIVYDLLSLRAGKSVLLHSAGGGVVSILQTLHFYFSSMSYDDVCQ
jgi:NADPH:quinone reductase-like Zn-dependent oxidoreductase